MNDAASRMPPRVDTDTPNASRVYDYMLGGAHNFAVDREHANAARQLIPGAFEVAKLNRRVLRRFVRELVTAGVRQFLDLGSGIPTAGNVHEIAQRVDPEARVVYVDNEAVAYSTSEALLKDNDHAGAVWADIRNPQAVFDDPITHRLLDLHEPVGLIMCTILHFLSDEDDPGRVVADYRDILPPGSYLAISHGAADGSRGEEMAKFAALYQDTPYPVTLRSHDEILRFFAGFTLVEPGLVPAPLWRPDEVEAWQGDPGRSGMYAGLGRKI